MKPIEAACYWLAHRPPAAETRLEGSQRAEIAIVGAGLTGLWTALWLKTYSPGLDVAVVEQGCAAYGASGRNAGLLSETIDHSHALAIEHFGLDEARRLARLGRDNIDEMTAFWHAQQIDCDYEPTGRMIVALHDAHLAALRHDVEVAARLGIDDYQLLDATQTQAELRSPLYRGALSVPSGGLLNPVKLVDGLRRVALSRGVKIYERSPVSSIRDRRTIMHLVTPQGTLDADKVVLATSAYTHHLLPRVLWRFIPLYDYIIVSEPLNDGQIASIGWQRRQGVTDCRNFFLYYRLTRDHRILWGTSEAVYYPGNKVGTEQDHSQAHYRMLEESFAAHFPQLNGLRFDYAWGGSICSTTRLTPYFGSAYGKKLWYGLGFTGHGLGSTHLAGKILARLALEQSDDLLSLTLVTRKPLPYPPEPLRALAVRKVTRDLRRVDEGGRPSLLLRLLDRLGVGFSS
ncbi:MAG: NAD(P)/FAD-dependent oxidoreductase [Gemmataceae bacterium]